MNWKKQQQEQQEQQQEQQQQQQQHQASTLQTISRALLARTCITRVSKTYTLCACNTLNIVY